MALVGAAVLIILVSCSAGNGRVRVKGNKFIDPEGKELVFRGLCFSDPVKLVRDGQWNERYFAEAADWGAGVAWMRECVSVGVSTRSRMSSSSSASSSTRHVIFRKFFILSVLCLSQCMEML